MLKSPGRLPKHYSPRARLVVMSWRDDGELADKIKKGKLKIENVCVIAHSVIPGLKETAGVSVIPLDAEAFARANLCGAAPV